MAAVRVEQAQPGQAATVSRLIGRFFAEEGFALPPAGGLEARVGEFLARPANAVFLAWRGPQAVGVATVTTTFGLESGLSGELEDLYVEPEMREAGVAGGLIQAVLDWCQERGAALLEVVVTPEGQQAHDLIGYYRRRGFADEGRRLLSRPVPGSP